MINLLEESPVEIAGVLVKCYPQNNQQVSDRLTQLPGTEVHVMSNDGSLIVTVEATEQEKNIIDTISNLNTIEGVIASSLIFHHNDAGLPQHQEEK